MYDTTCYKEKKPGIPIYCFLSIFYILSTAAHEQGDIQ